MPLYSYRICVLRSPVLTYSSKHKFMNMYVCTFLKYKLNALRTKKKELAQMDNIPGKWRSYCSWHATPHPSGGPVGMAEMLWLFEDTWNIFCVLKILVTMKLFYCLLIFCYIQFLILANIRLVDCEFILVCTQENVSGFRLTHSPKSYNGTNYYNWQFT